MNAHSSAAQLHLVKKTPAPARELRVGRFEASFMRTAAARHAIAKKDLAPLNLGFQMTIITVLGALPRLRALREDIVKKLPSIDITRFDDLEA